jgi:hypothetical protein
MTKQRIFGSTMAVATLLAGGAAMAAPANHGPPAQGATILDLNGHPTSTVLGTVLPVVVNTTFVAASSSTRLTFAMRNDGQLNNFLYLGNISLEQNSPLPGGGILEGPDLIANGIFDQGSLPGDQAPFSWIYDRPADASSPAGKVIVNPFVGPTTQPCDDPPCSVLIFPHVFSDTSVGEYDALSQTLNTIAGATYALQFSVWDTSQAGAFSRTDTEGPNRPSNGADVVVSVADVSPGSPVGQHVDFTAGQPAGAVPEPETWAMLIMGFFGLGAGLRAGRAPRTV